MFVDSIDRGHAELILERLRASTAMMPATQLGVLGGPMARVRTRETAFAHRTSRIMTNVPAVYVTPDEAPVHEAWVAELADALRQDDAGAYVNFLMDEGKEQVRAAYPGETWNRLADVKRRYDPTNLFRLNQNVPPAADG
jgi:Berberine and berberine like